MFSGSILTLNDTAWYWMNNWFHWILLLILNRSPASRLTCKGPKRFAEVKGVLGEAWRHMKTPTDPYWPKMEILLDQNPFLHRNMCSSRKMSQIQMCFRQKPTRSLRSLSFAISLAFLAAIEASESLDRRVWLRAFTQRQPGSRSMFKVNGRVDVV